MWSQDPTVFVRRSFTEISGFQSLCVHGEKFISKLYYFYKKIHYLVTLGHTQNLGFLLF